MPDLICDTSVLTALYQVGLMDILQALGAATIVPVSVEQELAAGKAVGHNVPDVAAVRWITIRSPTARPRLPFAKSLGPGESEVLWTSLESPGGIAVMDDRPARRAAHQLGVPFTGTLGLLVDAKSRGLIPEVKPVLDDLRHHGFHVSVRLRRAILKAAGEVP